MTKNNTQKNVFGMKATITDYLKNPFIIPTSTKGVINFVTYVYGDAYTQCDCGADLKLTKKNYNSELYEGSCPACGKKFEMFLNKIFEVK